MSKRKGSANTVLVAVGRRVEQSDAVTGAQLLAAELDVAGHGAGEADHRARPPQDLLGGGWQQGRILPEFGELVGVVEQRHQPLGERIPGGLAAGEGQHHEEQVELELVELTGGEDRPHVVGRVRPLRRAQLVRVSEQRDLRIPLLLLRRCPETDRLPA